jgi:hypothetical protein
MARTRSSVTAIAAAVCAVSMPMAASADVIHLRSGSTIEVEAWRDVGDAVEFTRGGGIVRIAKSDIARIVGQSIRQDLRMYSAPESLSGSALRATADRESALRDMTDLLKQGQDLFGQSALSARSKADAFRRLGAKWKELDAPAPLREALTRGQDAFQIAAEAFTAEDEGTAPNTKERVEAAQKAVREAQELLQKAGSQG